MGGEMKFRYRIKTTEGIQVCIVKLETLEKGFYDFTGVEILSRDMGTGQVDKHGTDIFANDILKQWVPSHFVNLPGRWQYGVVLWGEFKRDPFRGKKVLDYVEFQFYNTIAMAPWFQDEVEVAGTLYDNSDLLPQTIKERLGRYENQATIYQIYRL
jgi:hypothetical protein